MRSLLKLIIASIALFVFSPGANAQNCFNTGLNGTVINLPCGQNCVSVPIRIPHLKSSSSYSVNSIAYNPFDYVTPGGLEDPDIYDDDTYSNTVDLPFPFCFYDSTYTKVVVGSNGLITFDESNGTGGCLNAYTTNLPIPTAGAGNQCAQSGTYYPKAAIFGIYTDLDPTDSESPADRKIEWRVEGSAPCRRFVVSYYNVGVFGNTSCALANPTTFQIVIYESTGIVEVFIENYSCTASTSDNKAVLGMQNWNRNTAVWAPGKNSTVWTASNEGYRFTPSGGASRFVRTEVFALGGTVPIAVGDTITTQAGFLDVTFPSFCPTATNSQYVVKTTFKACNDLSTELVSYDTITINKTTNLEATLTASTPTACGVNGTGSATVTVPAGLGVAPYTYTLNPGNVTQTVASNTHTFTGLTAGAYTITVTDAGSPGCSSVIPVTITSTGVLNVTWTVTTPSCTGAANGSITINPPNGTPPILYGINTGFPTGTNNVFSNLGAGTYFVSVVDNAGCQALFLPITVPPGTGTLTGTAVATATSCPGVNNGSITVTPTSGSGPFQYQLNALPYQTSNIFGGLAPGAYTVTIRENGLCTSAPIPVTVGAGTALLGTIATTATSCNGAADGSITVTPTNGAGPYQYSLDNGPQQGSNVFNNVASGSHTVIIRDGSGCTSAAIPANVAAGAALTGTAVATNTACTGVNTGTITVTATNGTGPFQYSLDGGAPQAVNLFSNVSAGPHNVVIRNASGCVSANIPVTVGTGGGFTATHTTTTTSCNGAANGTITVTPGTGGTGPYTFVLDGTITQTGATSTTFTGVATGSHTIIITDAIGCQFTVTNATVTAGPALAATTTPSATSCPGVNNGSIVVTPTNGTGPYTFVLNGTVTQTGATTTTFTGVAAGSHTIQVTDANGCTSTLPAVTVTAGTGLTATVAPTGTSCAGATNGSITITPTNGTGPYSFVLNGTVTQSGATSTTFSGLAAGNTYTIVVTDAIGCVGTFNAINVTQGSVLLLSGTTQATSCVGAADGQIVITPSNGAGPYTFVLNGTVTVVGATTGIFTGLTASSYSIVATDAAGCVSNPMNITVNNGPALTATTATVPTSCPGVNNGQITVTPTNGTGPYTFVLDGTITQTGATSTSFTGVAAGPHTIQVTTATGCTTTLPAVTVASGTGVTATVAPLATSCSGATNGSITITPTNGTGPYTFVLNGSVTQNGATSTTFANLAAGNTYSIVVTDAIGCSGTFSNINVPQGAILLATATTQSTSCNGAANGQITITPSNGAGPYSFVLDGSLTQTGATSTTFANVTSGAHSIVVTDAAGCVSNAVNVTVTAGPAITLTLAKTDANCFGSSTGTITATTSANATAPLEYSLNNINWQSTGDFTNLAAGLYTVYVRDNAGCSNTATITIGQPADLAATSNVQNVLCNGQTNGVITITATGGTGQLTYSLNGNAPQTSNVFNVGAGSYSVQVVDANNCSVTVNNITVAEPAVLTATAITTNGTCDGGDDGTITITVVGGTAPFQYSSDGVTFQASNVLNAKPGSYPAVTVKDANNCTFTVNNVIVGLNNNLTLTPAADPAPICEGSSVLLELNTNATQYQWSALNPGLSSYSVASPEASPTVQTLYTVTVTLGVCTATDDILVDVMPAPIPNAGNDGDICFGQNYQLQGTGGSEYTWTPATFLSSTTDPSPQVLNPDQTTIYSLSVVDANGCPSLVSDEVTVNVTPPIQVTTFPVDTVVHAGAQFQLLATSAGTSYEWSPSTGLSNPNIADPVVTAPLSIGSVVDYIVTTTTAAGCTGEGRVTIRVYEGPDIYMVNAFTPNADGRNDVFVPIPVGIKQLNYFRVYNRWGQLLFSTKTLNHGWDGRLGGIEQGNGVYIWMVEGVTYDNKVITKKGSVLIVR